MIEEGGLIQKHIMKKIIGIFAIGICVLVSMQARAALIAEWQFNSYTAGGSLSGFHADYGTQVSTATLSLPSASKNAFTSTVGTTLNQNAASAPNNAITLTGGNGNPASAVLTIQISGTGLTGFILKYDTFANSGPQSWSYSTDGTTFFTTGITGGNPTTTGSYATYTVDFSGIAGLAGQTSVYFRDTFNWPGGGGSASVDNISITGSSINPVPEPINYAMALFGLVFVGTGVGRFYLGKARQNA